MIVFVFVGSSKHTQAATIAQTMPKAFWSFQSVLIQALYMVYKVC